MIVSLYICVWFLRQAAVHRTPLLHVALSFCALFKAVCCWAGCRLQRDRFAVVSQHHSAKCDWQRVLLMELLDLAFFLLSTARNKAHLAVCALAFLGACGCVASGAPDS
jgi:hypothetical protein